MMPQKQNPLLSGFGQRKVVYSLLCALVVLVLFNQTPVTLAQTATDPLAIFNALNNANNAGDVEGALNLFSEDAVVKVSIGTFNGKAEVRKWREAAKATQDRVELVGPSQVNGNKLTTVIRLVNSRTKAAGIDYLELKQEVTVVDGKIKELVATPTPETLPKLQLLAAQTGGQGGNAPAIPATGQGGNVSSGASDNFNGLALVLILGFLAVVAVVFLGKLNQRLKKS